MRSTRFQRPHARIWTGRVKQTDADEYVALMRTTGIPDYRSTAGNLGAWVLRREAAGETEVTMLTMWESLDAIRRFAGEPVDRARYYDFDEAYLLDRPDRVAHFEIQSDLTPAVVDPVSSDAARARDTACKLEGEERRTRLVRWHELRERAVAIDDLPGGVRLVFAPSEPLEPIAALVDQESECCAFYRFTVRVDGPARVLEVEAPGGPATVGRALLGLG